MVITKLHQITRSPQIQIRSKVMRSQNKKRRTLIPRWSPFRNDKPSYVSGVLTTIGVAKVWVNSWTHQINHVSLPRQPAVLESPRFLLEMGRQGGSDYNARRWNLLSIVVENSAAGAREIRVSGFISSVNWSCRSVVLWSKRIIETSEASVCTAAFFDPLLTLHSGGCHIIWGLIDSEGHLETFKYGVLAQLDDPIGTCDWIRTLSFLVKIEVEDVNGWSISVREFASFRWISGRVGVEILWVTLWE